MAKTQGKNGSLEQPKLFKTFSLKVNKCRSCKDFDDSGEKRTKNKISRPNYLTVDGLLYTLQLMKMSMYRADARE